MTTDSHRQVSSDDDLGVSGLWLFCIPGLAYSIFLTVIGFRYKRLCDETWILGGCGGGPEASCGEVLTSSLSAPFGIPLTIFSAAVYIVILVSLGAAIWSSRFLVVVRPFLLLITGLQLLVCLGLVLYTRLEFQTICGYCSFLYLINAILFWVATTMHRTRVAALSEIRALWSLRSGYHRAVWLLAPLIFVTAVCAQSAIHRTAVEWSLRCSLDDPYCNCRRLGERLPETNLEIPASQSPDVVLAIFLDLACRKCWDEFSKLQVVLSDPTVGNRVTVRFFHFPLDNQCTPPGSHAFNTHGPNRSCDAAKLVQCVGNQSPEITNEVLDRLFAFSRDDDVVFTDEVFESVLEDLTDPAPLLECLHNDTTVAITVHQHVEYAIQIAQFSGTPGIVIGRLTADGRLDRSTQTYAVWGFRSPEILIEEINRLLETEEK